MRGLLVTDELGLGLLLPEGVVEVDPDFCNMITKNEKEQIIFTMNNSHSPQFKQSISAGLHKKGLHVTF